MKKKVLFITGAGRSGSTLLGLMLGNGPNCFAAGELYALFWPRRPFHRLRDGCFCDSDSCTFWGDVKSSRKRNAYKCIFESRNVETVVDTSKHPLWLKDQLRYSVGERYSIKPIVIYKEPKEFARSLEKREKLDRWRSMWVKRHKWIFSITSDFISIGYKDLVNKTQGSIKKICKKLGISYFGKKEEFWKGDNSHFLFGSGKAKNANEIIRYDESYDIEELRRLDGEIDKSGKVLKILKALNKKTCSERRWRMVRV